MYPPHHLGGYELVWRSAMRSLRNEGHETRVLCSDLRLDGAASGAEPEDPGTFRELRWYWRDHAWPPFSWGDRVALERRNAEILETHLREFEPDVVSWWSMGGMSLSLMERVRRAGLPAVAFVADDWLLYGPVVDKWIRPFRRAERIPVVGRPVGRALAAIAERATGLPARVSLDDVARYVVISRTVLAAARDAGLRLDGATVARLGVDPAFLDPRPEQPWGWRLLYVGRIDERKGVEDAVRALTRLPEQTTLHIAGDGDPGEVARLRDLIARTGLDGRVELLGMRTHAELPAIYEACDAVLFPVRWSEPQGIVPLEAMALGRPVIATGMGGSAEYLADEVNCLLSPPSKPDGLARAVTRLAADPELRAQLRAGGAATAAHLTEPRFNAAVLAALTDAGVTN